MKTLMFSVLAAASMLFNTTAIKAEDIAKKYNLDGTNVRIAAVSASKSVVISLTDINEEVKISLTDETGTIFVNEVVKSASSFAKRYNLKQLETGSYVLTITKKMSKTIQPFELTSLGIVMKDDERKEKFLPNLSVNGKSMDVNVLLGNYSNIHVNVYSNDGYKVFEESNYVVLTLHKRYDLSKLTKGTYLVEVIAGDEIQYFPITL